MSENNTDSTENSNKESLTKTDANEEIQKLEDKVSQMNNNNSNEEEGPVRMGSRSKKDSGS